MVTLKTHKMPGLMKKHRVALATAIRSFLSGYLQFNEQFPITKELWELWAHRLEKDMASEDDYETARYIMGLPYSQPEYVGDTNNCANLIYALWVCNGTRFGNLKYTNSPPYPDDMKTVDIVAYIETRLNHRG